MVGLVSRERVQSTVLEAAAVELAVLAWLQGGTSGAQPLQSSPSSPPPSPPPYSTSPPSASALLTSSSAPPTSPSSTSLTHTKFQVLEDSRDLSAPSMSQPVQGSISEARG